MGRKNKYDEKTFPKRAEEYASKGLIDTQIAQNLGISPASFYSYQNKYPEFADAIKRGKSVIDPQVESSLLKRAMGFDSIEVKTEILKNGNKDDDAPSIKRVTTTVKQVIPDVKAQIIWLKNRRPDLWRDKPDSKKSGVIKLVLDKDEANL